jgi:hypothetical protein
MTLEFPNAPWAAASSASKHAKQVFQRVAKDPAVKPLQAGDIERMSLQELLYFALVEEGTPA